jgi:electron transfer flavoprotein alpha/beta subunit
MQEARHFAPVVIPNDALQLGLDRAGVLTQSGDDSAHERQIAQVILNEVTPRREGLVLIQYCM